MLIDVYRDVLQMEFFLILLRSKYRDWITNVQEGQVVSSVRS